MGKEKGRGPPFLPRVAGEKYNWSGYEVQKWKEEHPVLNNFDIRGPGVYAICHSETGVSRPEDDRHLETIRGVWNLWDAAEICNKHKLCTHFSVTLGPDMMWFYEPRQGLPGRLDLCKGPKVTMNKWRGKFGTMNSFAGVKYPGPGRRAASDLFAKGPAKAPHRPHPSMQHGVVKPIEQHKPGSLDKSSAPVEVTLPNTALTNVDKLSMPILPVLP